MDFNDFQIIYESESIKILRKILRLFYILLNEPKLMYNKSNVFNMMMKQKFDLKKSQIKDWIQKI